MYERIRPVLWLVVGSIALALASPAFAEEAETDDGDDEMKHQIHLRVQLDTLDDGDNTIYTFKPQGRLLARASRTRMAGYDLDTFTRTRLPMKYKGTKEEVTDEPPGSIESACIEWRRRCYEHAIVKIQTCDQVCTKIYDPETKTAIPVTDPETIYITIASDVVDFRKSNVINESPKLMQRRKSP